MARIGYARVSTLDQDLDVQLREIEPVTPEAATSVFARSRRLGRWLRMTAAGLSRHESPDRRGTSRPLRITTSMLVHEQIA